MIDQYRMFSDGDTTAGRFVKKREIRVPVLSLAHTSNRYERLHPDDVVSPMSATLDKSQCSFVI